MITILGWDSGKLAAGCDKDGISPARLSLPLLLRDSQGGKPWHNY
jgi:hypothetical protein